MDATLSHPDTDLYHAVLAFDVMKRYHQLTAPPATTKEERHEFAQHALALFQKLAEIEATDPKSIGLGPGKQVSQKIQSVMPNVLPCLNHDNFM